MYFEVANLFWIVGGLNWYNCKGTYGPNIDLMASSLPKMVGLFCYNISSKEFPSSVNARGLMLLLLLGGHVSLNPGPIALGVLNARSIRKKAPLFLTQWLPTIWIYFALQKPMFIHRAQMVYSSRLLLLVVCL